MSDFIDHIYISNFKSIRDSQIPDCKRINFIIGRPNVGKSNILEALSLFSIPYLRENSSRKLSYLVRLENETELFYNGNTEIKAQIRTNIANCDLSFNPKQDLIVDINFSENLNRCQVDDRLIVKGINNRPNFESPPSFPRRKDITIKRVVVRSPKR